MKHEDITLNTAEYWIEKLDLKQHPEGGYFKETYRCPEVLKKESLPHRYNGDRSISTTIYFLLKGNHPSAFHRIKSDELWHFYAGSPVTIFIITPDGELRKILLGNNPENNEVFQATIPAGCWFAAKVNNPVHFMLCGCTVSPGFDFEDFELADKGKLADEYPQHKELIYQC